MWNEFTTYLLQEWEQIQALMRKKGKEGLLRRVRLFDTVHVTENMVNSATQLLRDYDEERVRASSAGLGTFYKWVIWRALILSYKFLTEKNPT